MADHMESILSKELQTFLVDYPQLRVDRKRGRICCCLTGHEMPMKLEAVRSYVQGRKFLKVQQKQEYDFDQHKPHLVPNIKKGLHNTLFCTLTFRCVTKRPVDVERHVNGKRYQRALKRWQKCQETGEKFIPRGGRKKPALEKEERADNPKAKRGKGKSQEFWDPGSDSDEDDNVDDDFADLFPSDEADSSEEEEGEDSEEEEMNAENGDSVANNTEREATASSSFQKKELKRKHENQSHKNGKAKASKTSQQPIGDGGTVNKKRKN